jgi:hypothetical protein
LRRDRHEEERRERRREGKTYLGAHELRGVLLGDFGFGLGGDLVDDLFEVLLLVVDALGHGCPRWLDRENGFDDWEEENWWLGLTCRTTSGRVASVWGLGLGELVHEVLR